MRKRGRKKGDEAQPGQDDVDDVVEVPHSQLFLVGLALVLLVVALQLVWPYLAAVVLALVLGFLMQPLERRLVKMVRYPTLAASINLLLVFAVIVAPLAVIGVQLVDEAMLVGELVQDRDRLERSLTEALSGFGIERAQSARLVATAAERIGGAVQAFAIEAVGKVAHFFAGLLVFFILLFFVLRDGQAMARAARRMLPLRRRAADHLLQLTGERLRAIILGTFLVAAIQGIVAGLGWWFFGYPAPVFWGFVMTVIAVLPFGAPFLVMVPAALWRLSEGDWFAGIGMLVWTAVVVGLIDDVLRPYVVGRRSGVHPAIILVGTLGGLTVFGVTGFLLGPLFLSMLEPILAVWAEERQRIRDREDAPAPGEPAS